MRFRVNLIQRGLWSILMMSKNWMGLCISVRSRAIPTSQDPGETLEDEN